jgi:anti-anti-sigma factor
MTKIVKEGGKTIIKTGERIDTMNAGDFEKDIQPVLVDGGLDLELDCSDLVYMASSGLRVIQKTMRVVMQQKGQFKITNVNPEIYKVLQMTGFTKFMTVEKKKE